MLSTLYLSLAASGSLVMGGSENFDFCTSVLGVDVFWNYNPNDAVPNVDVLVQADNDGTFMIF